MNNIIKLNSGNNIQKLQKVNPIDMLPHEGEARDAVIQNLICTNRQTYMPVRLSVGFKYYYLEFVPNYLKADEKIINMSFNKIKPYNFIVNLVDGDTSKKEHILEMHCFGSGNGIFNDSNIKVQEKKQTSYIFEDGLQIVSDKYFTLNKDDVEYLIENFPERYAMIGAVTYYLLNTVSASYQIANYKYTDFFSRDKLLDIKIDPQHIDTIRALLNLNQTQDVFYEVEKLPTFEDFLRNQHINYDPISGSDHITAMSSAMMSSMFNISNIDIARNNELIKSEGEKSRDDLLKKSENSVKDFYMSHNVLPIRFLPASPKLNRDGKVDSDNPDNFYGHDETDDFSKL